MTVFDALHLLVLSFVLDSISLFRALILGSERLTFVGVVGIGNM